MKPWILTRDGVLNTLSSFEKLGTFFSVLWRKKKKFKKTDQTKKNHPMFTIHSKGGGSTQYENFQPCWIAMFCSDQMNLHYTKISNPFGYLLFRFNFRSLIFTVNMAISERRMFRCPNNWHGCGCTHFSHPTDWAFIPNPQFILETAWG